MALAVLVEHADHLLRVLDVVRHNAPSGLEIHGVPEDPGISEGLLQRDIGRLVAVVTGPSVQRPIAVAHAVRRIDPLVQIVFLATEETVRSMTARLGLTPNLGGHWAAVSMRPEAISGALRAALKATPQRRQFRTTLERVNVQIANPSEPAGEAYRRLIASDRFLAMVLAHAPAAIVSTDCHGTVLTWNHEAERLFGHAERDAVGRSLTRLLGSAAADSIAAITAQVAASHEPASAQVGWVAAPGRIVELSVMLAGIPNQAGHLVGVSMIARRSGA
jgi:PAS domain S-box-containing protein